MGEPLHYPTYRPFPLPPPHPPGCDCCKVGYRGWAIPTPFCIVDHVITHKVSLPQGEPEGNGFPASLSFPSAQACAAVEPLPGGRGRSGVWVRPQTPLVGSHGDEDEAYMQFSPSCK